MFPLESCHKLIRKFRMQLARKTSLEDNLKDVFFRLYLNSSPIMRVQKPKIRSRTSKTEKTDDDKLVETFFDENE